MCRLVEAEFAAVGHSDGGDPPPPFLDDWPADLDALPFELAHGRFDVIAHEVQLVMTSFVGWMGGQLRGREGEHRPPLARVHRRKLEHVPKECAHRFCVSGEDDGVNAADHDASRDRSRLPRSVECLTQKLAQLSPRE